MVEGVSESGRMKAYDNAVILSLLVGAIGVMTDTAFPW